MGRKIFLSVLGSGYYHEARYYHGNEATGKEPLVRFVQEANILEKCLDWPSNSKAYFFVTQGEKGSRKQNWNAIAQKDHPNGSYEGLSSRLEKLSLPFEYEAIDIPDGFSETEIWEIFDIVFRKIMSEDEVVFDITHAFRSIPMLVMVLLNYSKFLRNITVKHIFYGAFEKLGASYEVVKISPNERFIPVLDLISFSSLQDWTVAANNFIEFGNVEKLETLTASTIQPILRESIGKDEAAASFRTLNKVLPGFSKNIQTCRGKKIIENEEGETITRILHEFKGDLIKPLTPILENIATLMIPFAKKDNIKNGFFSVKWCLNNGLIQQGITLLKETITTLICDECNLDFRIEVNRNVVDSCFTIRKKELPEDQWKGDAFENKEITYKVLQQSKYLILLEKEFNTISGLRNDINHAGYKNNSISRPDDFEKKLKNVFCEVYSKIK